MAKITKRTVDALRAESRERVVWDDDIKGFGVRIHPSGKKVYIVKYRHRGRAVKTTIGPHGPVTPADARPRAAEIITAARTGRDPRAHGRYGAKSPTMDELVKRFLEEYVPAHCKPGTQEVYRSALEIHVVPRLGKRRVAEIERADMVALHHELRATPYQANRTIQVLSRIFTLAEVWGLRPDGSNPCRHVKRFREEKRERFLSDTEYGRLGAAFEAERRGGAGAAFSHRGGSSADADWLPEVGDPHAAMGIRRSGRWRVAVARLQNGSESGASRRPGDVCTTRDPEG